MTTIMVKRITVFALSVHNMTGRERGRKEAEEGGGGGGGDDEEKERPKEETQ
jgi:hypothetical protein